jgi:hypothetical protein
LVKVGHCHYTKGEKKRPSKWKIIYIYIFLDFRNCLNTKGKKRPTKGRKKGKKRGKYFLDIRNCLNTKAKQMAHKRRDFNKKRCQKLPY